MFDVILEVLTEGTLPFSLIFCFPLAPPLVAFVVEEAEEAEEAEEENEVMEDETVAVAVDCVVLLLISFTYASSCRNVTVSKVSMSSSISSASV